MSFIVAVPTIIVYLVLSKQFVRGLTLGLDQGVTRPAPPRSDPALSAQENPTDDPPALGRP